MTVQSRKEAEAHLQVKNFIEELKRPLIYENDKGSRDRTLQIVSLLSNIQGSGYVVSLGDYVTNIDYTH